MRYKIVDIDNRKEYYRKKLPRNVIHNIKNGKIFEVLEQYNTIGFIKDGEKQIIQALRTTKQ